MSNFGAELLEKIPSVGYGYFLEVYIQYLLLTVNLPVSGHLQDKIPSFQERCPPTEGGNCRGLTIHYQILPITGTNETLILWRYGMQFRRISRMLMLTELER